MKTFDSKLNSNGNIVIDSGFILNKLEDDARFADSGVANKYKLKKVIIVIHFGCRVDLLYKM